MPKPPTFPILFDDLKTISISFLSKHGYLKQCQSKKGTVAWRIIGNEIDGISVKVNTHPESPYLELAYKCNESNINYRIQLVSAPSNLGKGMVWFFVCPKTGKKCRKLYLLNDFFFHRLAFKGCMYEKQTQSKKVRFFNKTIGAYLRTDELFEQLDKKHFKKQYAGKPTKKYLKLNQQIERAESVPYHKILQALRR